MKTKILFVLCLLVGLIFINAGLNKFFEYMPVPEDMPEEQVTMFTAMMQVGWLMPLVAVAEISGGLLLIIPRLRALGAMILCPILAGIVLIAITVAPEGLPMVLAVVAVWIWVVIENRERYLPIIRS